MVLLGFSSGRIWRNRVRDVGIPSQDEQTEISAQDRHSCHPCNIDAAFLSHKKVTEPWTARLLDDTVTFKNDKRNLWEHYEARNQSSNRVTRTTSTTHTEKP